MLRTGKQKPRISKENARAKQQYLNVSLQQAELKQAQALLKTRTREVDEEINSTRNRLNISKDLPQPSGSNILFTRTTGEVGYEEISGRRYPHGRDGEKTLPSTRPLQDHETAYNRKEEEIRNLLRRLKKAFEESRKTPFQITEYFLPSVDAQNHVTTIPMSEAIGVFEVDLLQRLSPNDESLLSLFYTNESGDLRIKDLLDDLGYYDIRSSSAASDKVRRGISRELDRFDDDLDEDLPERFRDYPAPPRDKRPTERYTNLAVNGRTAGDSLLREDEGMKLHTTPLYSAYSEQASQAALNRSALSDIHALIQDSLPPDRRGPTAEDTRGDVAIDPADLGGMGSEYEDEVLLDTLRKEAAKEKQNASEHHRHQSVASSAGGSKTIEQVAVENVATALAIENARLKNELSAFDRDFFDELEDLKYKYSTLQNVVGDNAGAAKDKEDRADHQHQSDENKRKEDSTAPVDHSLNPEEVGRLGRSARSSLQALERGGMLSQSESRRRYPGQFVMSDSHMPDSALDAYRSNDTRHSYDHGRHSSRYGDTYRDIDNSYDRSRSSRQAHSPLRDSFLHPDKRDARTHDVNTHPPIAMFRKPNLSSSVNLASSGVVDDYTGLCERRLLFELQNHIDPSKATNALVHRVVSVAQHRQGNGFITPEQLHYIMREIGLNISLREVELFAEGFASNGRGGIDAMELCQAVQTMMYNATGADAADRDGNIQLAVKSIVWNIASDVLVHKNYAKLLRLKDSFTGRKDSHLFEKMEVEVFDAISKPFIHMDDNENGILTVKGFSKIVHHFSSGLPDDELYVLIEFLKAEDEHEGHQDPYQRGETHHHRHDHRGNRHHPGEPIRLVYYKEFITLLVDAILEKLMDDRVKIKPAGDGTYDDVDNIDPLSSTPWLLREFDFVDNLLNQLENQSSGNRRKMLIQLQSILVSQAEGAAIGTGVAVDGFAVLKALVDVGFHIPRELRVHFLQQVEKMAGVFNFVDLCKVLMSSCLDWSSNERMVMGKILKAMGTTTNQRRLWLNRLKKDLQLSAADARSKNSQTHYHESHQSGTSSWQKLLGTSEEDMRQLTSGYGEDGLATDEPALSATTFLHCLRQAGISLSVDEEATLLDCLDFELHARESLHSNTSRGLLTNHRNMSYGPPLGTPRVKYSSFVALCARHIGKWYQASPEINENLKAAIVGMKETAVPLAIREFQTLLQAFDESNTGSVTYRPFLVACRRSRLMCNMEPSASEDLAKVLAEEDAGEIAYYPFVMHLRSLHHQMKKFKAINKTIVDGAKAESYDMLNQMLKNCSDVDDGTFRPLRFYLVDKLLRSARHGVTDGGGISGREGAEFELSHRDVTELLREFNVVYSPEDMELFKEDVNSSSSIRDYFAETPNCPLHLHDAASPGASFGVMKARDIIHCLQQMRPAWPKRNPRLAMRLKKMLSRASTDLVEKIIMRIRAFARAELMQVAVETDDDDGDEDVFGGRDDDDDGGAASSRLHQIVTFHDAFAPKEVFARVLRKCGLPLTEDDVYFLCDESDPNPQAGFVRISVLLEAMCESEDTAGVKYQLEGVSAALQKYEREKQHTTRSRVSRRPTETSDKTLFAMEHLKIMLWHAAEKLHRTPSQWVSDVTTMLNGFDRGGGVCTPEDFTMGMRLLSIHISEDILSGIPRVASQVDMIPFRQILDIVLDCYDTDREHILHLRHDAPRYKPLVSSHRDNMHDVDDLPQFTKRGSRERSRSPVDAHRSRFGTLPHEITRWEAGRSLKGAAAYKDLEIGAVKTLVDVVRRRLNIFIGDRRDIEQAWASMLTVFSQFDSNEEHMVTPRDFCLAVSVLMDNDSPVLTKQEWEDIIMYFQATADDRDTIQKEHLNSPYKVRQRGSTISGMVNYLAFLDLVLDSSDVRAGSNGAGHARRGRSKSPSNSRSTVAPKRGMHHSTSYKPVDGSASTSPHNPSREYLITKPSKYNAKAGSNGLTSRLKGSGAATRSKLRVSYQDEEDERDEHFYDKHYDHHTPHGKRRTDDRASSYDNSRRSDFNHSRETTQISHTRDRTKYDELFGAVRGDPTTSLSHDRPALTQSQLRYMHDMDMLAIKELNGELESVLSAKLASCPNRSMKELLRQYLVTEDKDRSGTLILHNVKAVLQSLGIAYHFLVQPSQKALLEDVARKGRNGLVVINDLLKLIYLP